jgi:putative peptidoglycan lipid II flippase
MIASSAPQWLMVAGGVIASASPSAVSWLYFANRLIELPLGIVGVAMGTVLIPEMTRALHSGDRSAIARAESRGLELAVGLALPATLGLIVLSDPIVRILFEHGAFAAHDATATAHALTWLALGLPAHVLVKALSPAFFAREDTRTPLAGALAAILVTIVAAFLLRHEFGTRGIAAGITLGAWSNALYLIRKGGMTFGFSIDTEARDRLPRICLAGLAMGALLWLLQELSPLATGSRGLAQVVALFAVIFAAMASYGLFLKLFGVIGWREAVAAIRQNRAA